MLCQKNVGIYIVVRRAWNVVYRRGPEMLHDYRGPKNNAITRPLCDFDCNTNGSKFVIHVFFSYNGNNQLTLHHMVFFVTHSCVPFDAGNVGGVYLGSDSTPNSPAAIGDLFFPGCSVI